MRIIDIPGGQGSAAWLQHRRDHFNASDAPAMMGCSPYKTRNELLHETFTGIAPEVDAGKQRLFDDGHRTERLLRPIAEAHLGDDLYPIIVANGRLSASLDGATLEGAINAEFKRLNQRLRDAMHEGCTGEALPLDYRVQMEHQLHCSGAEKVLFMAGEFDDQDGLVEERHCWYYPDPALRAQILAGWAQFQLDVANYTPQETAPIVTAAPVEHLPAVSVQVQGSLAVVSNLQPFGVALRAFVDHIPKKPATDQEFADTEAACKRLKEAEDRLQAAEDSALASMADVNEMRRMVADFRDLARSTRLTSEKLVKQRKEQIREEEVERGRRALRQHVDSMEYFQHMPPITADFAGVIKGLKTIDSLRNAIDTELARAKIEASQMHERIASNVATIGAAKAPALFADRSTLVLKDPEAVAAIVAQRLAEHQAAEQKRLDAERERIRAEEQARAQAEAAKAAEVARQQQEIEAARQRAESAGVAAADAAGSTKGTAVTPGPSEPEAAPITTNAQESGCIPGTPGTAGTPAGLSASAEPEASQGPATAGDEGPVAQEVLRAADPAPPPTLKLGDINTRLAPVQITAAGLAALGFEPAATEKAAKLYHATDWAAIKTALIAHIKGAC